MSLSKFKGKTALVTGASSGIGECFATQLAEQGTNLILVARRTDRLETLKEKLEAKHGIQADVISLDLAQHDAPKKLFEATEGAGKQVDILLNNAGYGKQHPFTKVPLETQLNMLDLNIRTLTELSHLFIEKMKERRSGHILLVGSVVGYFAVPGMATYAASKAYVKNLVIALNTEYGKYGVGVTALNPGATATEFSANADQEFGGLLEKLLFMSADKVAAVGLSALAKNKASVVPGVNNCLTVFFMNFMPVRMQSAIAAMIFK